MNKIELFLNQLNQREKLLLSANLIIIAIFLAFHFNNFLSSYLFKDSFLTQNYNIEKEKLLSKTLEKDLLKLEQDLRQIQRKNSTYQQYLILFNKNYEDNIKNIQKLALKNNISIKNITNIHSYKKQFSKYEILIKSYGDFKNILYFIQDIENSDFYYQINELEIENSNTLNLELNINISFLYL